MLILDTDHLAALDRKKVIGERLAKRLEIRRSEVSTTIVSISEQLSGLLALIASPGKEALLIENYGRLALKLEDLQEFVILPWTTQSASVFDRLRREKLRIGTMDLRIASIALANNATVLTANLRDFRKVPDLRTENWLD